MTEQEELLKKVAEILDELNIPYIVTGGIAVTVWGRPRFTADIDVVIELLPQKLDDLAEQLLAIDKDVYADKRSMQRALEKQGEFNFIHPASGLKVDFWILKSDVFGKEQLKRKVRKKIGEVSVDFISPEDLILSKLLWHKESGSDRQLEDVVSVLRKQKKLDWRYLQKWSKTQSTAKVLGSLLKKN
jgi:hypothetical protein